VRKVSGLSILLLTALIAFWWAFTRTGRFLLPADPAANVLLITIDTLRADALGVYGGKAKTPNIDRLAEHGVRFDNAHAQGVVTLVSHASILTGRYPYETGVRDNAGYRLSPDADTLASRLKARGFDTGAFIAGFPLTRRFGLTRGFDVYDDQIAETASHMDFSLPERRADVVVARAIDWINRRDGRQFFGWVHLFDPHAPYAPPEQWKAQYANPYDGEVAWTDSALAALFDRLATLPRRTVVVITADHGEGLGDHGEMTHGFFAYESTLRVPLIIADIDPKATEFTRGRVVSTPVRHVDIVPTVLDALSANSNDAVLRASGDPLSGTSLRDVIAGRSNADRPSYFEAMTGYLTRGWAPLRGVIAGDDKFIDLPIPELYALDDDPSEQRNTASSDTARVDVLRNTLGTFDTSLPGAPAAESPAVSAQLRSLGYASGGVSTNKTTFSENDDPKRLIELDRDLHAANDFYQQRRYQEAVAMFDRVIARRPDLVDAYRYKAYVLWQIGQPAAAIATLETALTMGIADQDIRTRLGTFLAETGSAEKAIPLLSAAPDEDVDAMNALGIAYGFAGRDREALAAFNRVLEVDPTNGRAMQNIATIKLRQNDVAAAKAWIDKALAADPSLADAYTTMGVIAARSGRGDEAIEAWRRAVELDNTSFDAMYNLVFALAKAGNTTEASRYADMFVQTAPPARYSAEIAEIRRLGRT
jgi:arylsulfatase A-like enzyme/tetratricopeptide (TPR) repeat protein